MGRQLAMLAIALGLAGCGATHTTTVTQTITRTSASASATQTTAATESTPRVPGALGVSVQNYDTSIEANPQNLEEITADRQCTAPAANAGALIDQLQPGGPAAVAGLSGGKPMKAQLATGAPTYVAGYIGGDVIEAMGGNPTPDTDVLLADTAQYRAGDVVQVTVLRCDGSEATVPVTLEPRP
jgi:S1-C subfamily serine protease